MAIRDALAPIIQLLLFILYGIYIFLGLVLMIAGIYYVSSIEGANTFAAVVCIMCGFFMLIVGALAIFGNLKKNALIFAVVLLIDVALFVLLLAAMMVGMAIVNEVKDPVAKAVNEAYCDNPAESLNSYCSGRSGAYSVDNEGVLLRQSVWDGVVKLFDNGAPASCKVYDASLRIQSKATTASAATCDTWDPELATLAVTRVDEACVTTVGCSDDELTTPTECEFTESADDATDSALAKCEKKNAAAKGKCTLVEKVIEVAAESNCGKGAYEGCFYHMEETYVAEVAPTCDVSYAPTALLPNLATANSKGAISYLRNSADLPLLTEMTVQDFCVGTKGVTASEERCVKNLAWSTDIAAGSAERADGQTTTEIDTAKECQNPTVCAMSQSDVAGVADVAASCVAESGYGAATCSPLSDDPKIVNDCALVTSLADETACEAVATWVTSDDSAATADGLIPVGDKFSPAACKYRAAALPTCGGTDYDAVPTTGDAGTVAAAQNAACTAVPGCEYTAKMLGADAVTDPVTTPGACVVVQGDGECSYAAPVVNVPDAVCDILVSAVAVGTVTTPASCGAAATGSGTCAPNAGATACDVTPGTADQETTAATTCPAITAAITATAAIPGTCQLSSASAALTMDVAGVATARYTAAADCTHVSGAPFTVACKLTDETGLKSATGATGTGVIEECYEASDTTSVYPATNDDNGVCAFVAKVPGVVPTMCNTAVAGQTAVAVAGTCAGKLTADDGACNAQAELACGTDEKCAWTPPNCESTDALPTVGISACNTVSTVTGLTQAADSTQFKGAAAKMLQDETCAKAADCKTMGTGAGNCTEVGMFFGPATKHECKKCWDDWQTYSIEKIKGNLWPATIVIWSLFLFVVILVCVNNYMIDNCEDDDGNFGPDGLWKIIGIVFNGIVALFGLLTMIMGIVAHSDLSGGCPDGKDCTNWAVVGVIVLGIFFILTAILSLVGMLLGKFPGMMMVRVADLILVILGLLLLIIGIGFAIIAGAMDDINSANENNFEQVRANYESEDPDLCKGLSDSACRTKIKEKTEGGMTTIVIVLGLVCFEFIFVIFLTLQAFYIYKGGDGDDDDDDDDD